MFVYRQLQLVEPVDGAGVRLLTQNRTLQQGVVERAQTNIKINEDGEMKLLKNVVKIHCSRRAITDRGDSGTLVFLKAEDRSNNPHGANAVVERLSVCGMAVGRVDLDDGTSFTVANRLREILSAIHRDPKNCELFRGYRELNLCGISRAVEERDSGFASTPP